MYTVSGLSDFCIYFIFLRHVGLDVALFHLCYKFLLNVGSLENFIISAEERGYQCCTQIFPIVIINFFLHLLMVSYKKFYFLLFSYRQQRIKRCPLKLKKKQTLQILTAHSYKTNVAVKVINKYKSVLPNTGTFCYNGLKAYFLNSCVSIKNVRKYLSKFC